MHPAVPARNPSSSPVGQWFLAFLGLSLAAAGGVFFSLMWRSYDRAREMHAWPEVECIILSSEVEERRIDPNSPHEFRVNVLYGYEWEGQRLSGERITSRGNPWTSKTGVIEAQAAEFPTGSLATCRVDPQNPSFSILKPDSKAAGYSLWFPGLFIVGGLGITFRALVTGRYQKISSD